MNKTERTLGIFLWIFNFFIPEGALRGWFIWREVLTAILMGILLCNVPVTYTPRFNALSSSHPRPLTPNGTVENNILLPEDVCRCLTHYYSWVRHLTCNTDVLQQEASLTSKCKISVLPFMELVRRRVAEYGLLTGSSTHSRCSITLCVWWAASILQFMKVNVFTVNFDHCLSGSKDNSNLALVQQQFNFFHLF